MNREKDLAKNTIIIFIGTICTKLISFFLLPLYTGILTTTEYGTVDLLNTLIALVSPLLCLQFNQGVFRKLIDNRNDETKKKELISTSILFVIVNSFIYLLIFLLISPLIHNDYKYFLATNVIASVFADLLLQISRGLGNNKEYSVTGILTAILTIVFNVLFLVSLKLGVNGMLAGTLLGYIGGIVYLFFRLKLYKYLSILNYKKSAFKELIKYSLPLVPNQLSWWVFGMSDRVIVSFLLGLSFTGILSVAYKFSGAFIIIYNIFNMSWTESMALHINDKDVQNYFNKMFNMISNLFISFGVLIIAFMPMIFKFLVNGSYNLAYNLIPIAMVAAILQVIVGLISVVYLSKNNTKAIAHTSIISAIINITVHLALIKFVGIYAAVISTLASYLVFAIYRTFDVSKKYIKVNIDCKKMLISFATLGVVLLAYYSDNNYFKFIVMALSIVYFYIINKNSFKSIINMIKEKIGRKN